MRNAGGTLMRGDCTSAYSIKINDYFGWNIASEILFKDIVDANGNPIFEIKPPHTKYQLRYKIL